MADEVLEERLAAIEARLARLEAAMAPHVVYGPKRGHVSPDVLLSEAQKRLVVEELARTAKETEIRALSSEEAIAIEQEVPALRKEWGK